MKSLFAFTLLVAAAFTSETVELSEVEGCPCCTPSVPTYDIIGSCDYKEVTPVSIMSEGSSPTCGRLTTGDLFPSAHECYSSTENAYEGWIANHFGMANNPVGQFIEASFYKKEVVSSIKIQGYWFECTDGDPIHSSIHTINILFWDGTQWMTHTSGDDGTWAPFHGLTAAEIKQFEVYPETASGEDLNKVIEVNDFQPFKTTRVKIVASSFDATFFGLRLGIMVDQN